MIDMVEQPIQDAPPIESRWTRFSLRGAFVMITANSVAFAISSQTDSDQSYFLAFGVPAITLGYLLLVAAYVGYTRLSSDRKILAMGAFLLATLGFMFLTIGVCQLFAWVISLILDWLFVWDFV